MINAWKFFGFESKEEGRPVQIWFNDKQGKAVAKHRFRELMRGRAGVHRFDFEGEAHSKT